MNKINIVFELNIYYNNIIFINQYIHSKTTNTN